MRSTIRYIGLDVHKETIVIGVAESGGGEPDILAKIAHHWPTLRNLLKRLGPPENLRCCYEAGPTGYGIYRKLKAAGIPCIVVAVSRRRRGTTGCVAWRRAATGGGSYSGRSGACL